MICFMDRAFCTAYRSNLCKNHNCYRAYTPELQGRAKVWAIGLDHIPIAFVDIDENQCEFAILK